MIQRKHVVSVRLSDGELHALEEMARRAHAKSLGAVLRGYVRQQMADMFEESKEWEG